MDAVWREVGPLLTASVMLVLCVALLRLGAGSAPVLAFVAFLILRAGVIVFAVLGNLLHGDWLPAAIDTIQALNLAMVVAIVGFLSYYPRPWAIARRAWWPALLVATVLALVAIALLDPCAVICEERALFGPLYIAVAGVYLLEAAGGLILIRHAASRRAGQARTAIQFVAIGFLTDATVTSVLSASILSPGPADGLARWDPDALVIVGSLSLPVVSLALVAIAGALGMRAGLPAAKRAAVGLTALALAGALTLLVAPEDSIAYPLAIAVLSTSRLVLPVLAGIALMRHRLFDIDITQRRMLNGAAIGSFFAGVFFVASEAGAYYLGTRLGVFAGILLTGLALPFLSPIRRVAERVISRAIGGPDAVSKLSAEERLRLYEEFAREAWADGRLARTERAFLDDVRRRLNLSFEDAAHVESAAASGAQIQHQDVI